MHHEPAAMGDPAVVEGVPCSCDTKPETILEEAQRLVYGDRQEAYGHPRDDFGRTAGMWTALFGRKLADGERFTPEDVAMAMACVKLSRLANAYKRDSAVDLAGYAATLARVAEGS